MHYYFQHAETVADGFRRILVEQVLLAAEELSSNSELNEGIHNARKCFKRIGSVLQLMRAAGSPVDEGVVCWFRAVAKSLAAARNSDAMLETYDRLAGDFPRIKQDRTFSPVRQQLHTARRMQLQKCGDVGLTAKSVSANLRIQSETILSWPFSELDENALNAGLAQCWCEGDAARKKAKRNEDARHFHSWRKRVQTGYHYSQLLSERQPSYKKLYQKPLKTLADRLGYAHDLAVLQNLLAKQPQYTEIKRSHTLRRLVRERERKMWEKSLALGSELYARPAMTFSP